MSKHALITGASSGIGEAFAHRLSKQGYSLCLVARSENKLKSLSKSLPSTSSILVADLSTHEGVDLVCQYIIDYRTHLLINNAAAGWFDRFSKTDSKKNDELIQLSIRSLVHLSQAFLKQSQSGDVLLNVSSIASLLPYPGSAVYAATKAFVTNFTEALWYEQKDRGVYVTAVLPGVTRTNFNLAANGKEEYSGDGLISQSPEQVVDKCMLEIRRRTKPSFYSSIVNHLIVFVNLTFIPKKWRLSIMGKASPGMRTE